MIERFGGQGFELAAKKATKILPLLRKGNER